MSLVIGFLGAFWHAIAQRRLKTFFVSTVKRSLVVSALKLHHRGAFCSRAISSLGLRLSLLEQFSVASVRRRAFLHHCNKLLDVLDFETRFFSRTYSGRRTSKRPIASHSITRAAWHAGGQHESAGQTHRLGSLPQRQSKPAACRTHLLFP